ncbi:MAG: hypothetical protein Q9168_007003 [Polycauliona sp. 1 TL-2023]
MLFPDIRHPPPPASILILRQIETYPSLHRELYADKGLFELLSSSAHQTIVSTFVRGNSGNPDLESNQPATIRRPTAALITPPLTQPPNTTKNKSLQRGVEPTMGLSYNVYLNSDKIFGCKNCKTHLASHDAIISRNFRGQHGKAYLFNTVVNTTQTDAVERNMTTGRHQVRDVICKQCKETVGWKYDKAYETSEKYKEGKFILEAELLCSVY